MMHWTVEHRGGGFFKNRDSTVTVQHSFRRKFNVGSRYNPRQDHHIPVGSGIQYNRIRHEEKPTWPSQHSKKSENFETASKAVIASPTR